MTQEEKQLLLKDLCARLPYYVNVNILDNWSYDNLPPYHRSLDVDIIDGIRTNRYTVKPYLRPMPSMTDGELKEWTTLLNFVNENRLDKSIDWLNAHHFDYRGLIEMGLALEAPEDMYKDKNE